MDEVKYGMKERKELAPREIRRFRRIVCEHYRRHGRLLPWRAADDPYRILVSEIMLQQTQVERVMEKYERFIAAFPDFASLSRAPLSEIFAVWRGLGYNRRAVALKRIAHAVMEEFGGKLPSSADTLAALPGIGKATASAIAAFAFHQPAVFIETNIRRVYIHFFFEDSENVRDAEILPLVEITLDRSDPRQWYYALMDYGVKLKKEVGNPNRRSAHYRKQSPFEGSNRQLRGMILKLLSVQPGISEAEIVQELKAAPEKISENLLKLQSEGFIKKKGKGSYRIA